jgi:hypothetical protein
MTVHEFSVIIAADPEMSDEELLEIGDQLGEAGCLDATLSTHRDGVEAFFDREADDLAQAVKTAVQAVTKAGYRVVRVELQPDDWLLSEAASAS